jgi:hypothetical protein
VPAVLEGAWLERVGESDQRDAPASWGKADEPMSPGTLMPRTRIANEADDGKPLCRCQATRSPRRLSS